MSLKGSVTPGEHLVEDGSKRKEIAAVIGLEAFGLFRRHIRGRPENDSRIRPGKAGLAKWPVYEENKSPGPMFFGEKIEAGPRPDAAQLRFFQAHYEKAGR